MTTKPRKTITRRPPLAWWPARLTRQGQHPIGPGHDVRGAESAERPRRAFARRGRFVPARRLDRELARGLLFLMTGLSLAVTAARAGATTTTIDTSGPMAWPSIKVGGDGLPLVAYYLEALADLKVAHCNNPVCTDATVTTLDSMGDVGREASLAIGSDGLGLIAYRNYSDQNLKVAHCSNAACTSVTISTLDDGSFSPMGGAISIGIGSDGLGLISYFGYSDGLKIAHCNDVACTSASFASVAAASLANGVDAVIGADGRALLVFMDMSANRTYAVHCNDVACSGAAVSVVDVADSHDTESRPLSAVLGPDNLGLVAYVDGNYVLKTAHCLDAGCTTSALSILRPSVYRQDVGFTLGANGRGLIAHQDAGGLWLARCTNATCSAVTSTLLDDAGGPGGTVGNRSMVLGRDNFPLVAYFTSEGSYPGQPHLKVAHLDSLEFDRIFADGFD